MSGMKRIPSLDGLRAISVSLVLIGHLAHSGLLPAFLATYAGTGVKMFFVISGYLITTILLQERSRTSSINLGQFYIRRGYRILPAAGVFILFACLAYWRDLHWYDMCAAIFYLMDFSRNPPPALGHLWSLAVEEQFYLLWPNLLKRFYRHKVAILLGGVLISPLYLSLCFYLKLPARYGTFPAVVDTLAIGCLLAIFSAKIPKIKTFWASAMLLSIILTPFFPAITPARTLFSLFVLSPVMFFSMAGLIAHVVQTPYRILNIAPVTWLGRISYSLYLWQQPFFFRSSPQPMYKLALGVGLACLSYYLVERPFLKLREKRNASILSAPALKAVEPA